MRFRRFSLPLLTALLVVLVLAAPLNAQKNEGHAQNAKRVGRMPKEVDPSGVSPTAANYQVSQTTGVIVSGSTQVTGFSNLDDGTANVVLPFPYAFYDQTFTAMNVSTNGNLQFLSNNTDYGQLNVCFPLGQFNYAIMPHWGDLTIAGANEGVFTSITGSAPNRIFNIEWRTSLIGNASGSLNFEVRLYENQARFDFVYGTAPNGGREVTVGAEQGGGATYTEFSCHQSSLRNGMMLVFNGTAATSLFIAGRVTDPDGNPVAGATVNLTGNATAVVTTDGTGDYSFTDLSSGGTYSVAATQAGFNFFPQVRNFGPGNRAFTGNFIVNFIRTTPPNGGDVIISEFRFHGQPFPTVNEFVEIQNNTNQGITVNATDSAGWLVTTLDPAINFLIPNGTTIPARGHYLGGNGSGYNLYGYGSADTFYSGDIPAGGGVAIFSTSDPASINLAHRLDAAGFAGAQTSDLFREGSGLISPGTVDGNYSFVRKLTSGNAQDTNNNGADFQFVSPDGGIYGGVQSTLGAPGPENSASPIQRNAQIKASLIDPVAGQVNPPNRVRNSTPNSCGGANCALGTLTIRRRFTNSTGQSITRLRFRIVDITTMGNIVAGQADLRALNSSDAVVTITGGTTVQVRGLTIEQGPELPDGKVPQPNGGGMNSSMVVGVINVAQPLAPGANVNVEFRLGVQTGGSFRFFINVEALP
jgi:Carboxypeptidase regulatory-like domain